MLMRIRLGSVIKSLPIERRHDVQERIVLCAARFASSLRNSMQSLCSTFIVICFCCRVSLESGMSGGHEAQLPALPAKACNCHSFRYPSENSNITGNRE
ncbi:hypothetical protein BDV35DRAFT_144093 [Aspergillus flavus]|uniref:Uncharacterized protein n=1 Tax=Aspergillus flavus TaxID=5059 RepID=A0A5N6H561_ASPFL|nr:hypothetical protein BDV35DRAFT_144093 [Aspergillus flavus]